MGNPALTRFSPWVLAVIIYGTVFAEAHYNGAFRWLGVKLDVIPCLIVYAALHWGLGTLTALAIWAGLCFDSLSGNPLGGSVLSLFLVGFVLHRNRENLLYDSWPAQVLLGTAASVAAPLLTLVQLVICGYEPLAGWMTIWQLIFLGVAGGLAAPLIFQVMERLGKALSYEVAPDTSFRPDREIKRGKF